MNSRKKRKKLTLDEVETQMEVLTKEEMDTLRGGGNGSYGSFYNKDEFYALLNANSFYGSDIQGWDYFGALEGIIGSSFGSNMPPDSDFYDQIWEKYETWKNQMMYGSSNYYGNQFDNGYGSYYYGSSNYYGSQYDNGYGSYYYGSDGIYGSYYENYYGQNEENSAYSGGGGGAYHNEPKDGVNINNSKHFTFNTQGNATFDRQLKDILSTNKTIKGLLSYFDKGIVHMTFGVKDLGQKRTAQTNYVSSDSYHIEFNSQMINQYGWNLNYQGTDNIGYDFSKARTAEERLVITLAHEAMHAKHYATFQDAQREMGDRNANAVANNLLNRGYSQEFVEIYFIKNSAGKWDYNRDGNNVNDRAHEYMRKYNHRVIDKALEEYRRDRGL